MSNNHKKKKPAYLLTFCLALTIVVIIFAIGIKPAKADEEKILKILLYKDANNTQLVTENCQVSLGGVNMPKQLDGYYQGNSYMMFNTYGPGIIVSNCSGFNNFSQFKPPYYGREQITTPGTYYGTCNPTGCSIPGSSPGTCTLRDFGWSGLTANETLPINTDGWYGADLFQPNPSNFIGEPQLSPYQHQTGYNQGGVEYVYNNGKPYYTVDTTMVKSLNYQWQVNLNSDTGLAAYAGYRVDYTTTNGNGFGLAKNTYCLNGPDAAGKCKDSKTAELYNYRIEGFSFNFCPGEATVSYPGGTCQVKNNLGQTQNSCVNNATHNVVVQDIRQYSGKILRFATTEKFYQGVGGTDIKENFVKYSVPVLFDISLEDDYQLSLILKGRNTAIDDISWCDAEPDQGTYPGEPTLCEKRGDTYFLRNGEIYNYYSFVKDSRGNYLNPSQTGTTCSFSTDNGVSWTNSAWTTSCFPQNIAGVGGMKRANSYDPDRNHLANIYQLRSSISQGNWQTKEKLQQTIRPAADYWSWFYNKEYFGGDPQLNLESNVVKTAFNLPTIEVFPEENNLKNTTGQDSAKVTIRNSNSSSYPDTFKIYSGDFLSSFFDQSGNGNSIQVSWLIGPDPDPQGKTVDKNGIVDVGHTPITFSLNADNLPEENQDVFFRIRARGATPFSDKYFLPGSPITITESESSISEAFNTHPGESTNLGEFTCDPLTAKCNWDYAKISYEKPSSPVKKYKALFIGNQVNIETDNLEIDYDSTLVYNIPPGFREILAPIWEEVTP